MIRLSSIIQQFESVFLAQYQGRILPSHRKALAAMKVCRTHQSPRMLASCCACHHQTTVPHSCGHRNCPHCQNFESQQWLERQLQKRVPAPYFLLTFTLPAELRSLTWRHQRLLYALMIQCVWETVRTFSQNDKQLRGIPGAIAVLHTHSRRLDYHPHLHLVVPGGGINQRHNAWRTLKGKYLFNGKALAAAFRGCLLAAIADAGLNRVKTPKKWVAQCQNVGRGAPALKYLSRYLYRGVISDNNIVRDDGTHVTFRYKDSQSGKMKTRCCRGEDFIALVLQHVLPKGFRRVRDYGFLHGNAKRVLKQVQWLLRVTILTLPKTPRPSFICRHCRSPMLIIGFMRPNRRSG